MAYGLAMMALVWGGGGALALSAIAAVMALVVLRRDRGAKVAWVALVLAILTLVVGTTLALRLFWPSER